jgi:hypothetical protein
MQRCFCRKEQISDRYLPFRFLFFPLIFYHPQMEHIYFHSEKAHFSCKKAPQAKFA